MLLLDERTQLSQLCALERRTTWGGKSSIDHPQTVGAYDDAANVLAGATVLAMGRLHHFEVRPALLNEFRGPSRAAGNFARGWPAAPVGRYALQT